MNGAWLYLLLASAMEMCWMISLKYLDFKAIKNIDWNQFLKSNQGIITILPLLAYILFGLGNVVFFSMATKSIPLATAFAAWLGVALIGSVIIDMIYFKIPYTFIQLVFLLFIVTGVIGLKIFK